MEFIIPLSFAIDNKVASVRVLERIIIIIAH